MEIVSTSAFVKDVLLAVAVVIVDVQDRHLAEAAEVVGGDSGIEVAETAEATAFGMVAGRSDECIRDRPPLQNRVGRGQRKSTASPAAACAGS